MPARSIWHSWNAAFAVSHSSCEIAATVASESSRSRASWAASSVPDRALGRVQLERQPNVVPLATACARDRRDVVAAPRLDGQEPFGDESRQRVVHGAARDAELGGELVQEQLRARARARGAASAAAASRTPAR